MTTPAHITLSGAPEGYDARLLAEELAKGAPVCHIARDDKRMEAMRAALAFFAPGALVLTFPAWDCLPYDRVSPNADTSATRMAALAALAQGLAGAVHPADDAECGSTETASARGPENVLFHRPRRRPHR